MNHHLTKNEIETIISRSPKAKLSINQGNFKMNAQKPIQHTAAPWRIGNAGETILGASNAIDGEKLVAKLPKVSAPCKASDIDESIANARLIAAAPDMLVVLEMLARYCSDYCDPHMVEIANNAFDVIATARGYNNNVAK